MSSVNDRPRGLPPPVSDVQMSQFGLDEDRHGRTAYRECASQDTDALIDNSVVFVKLHTKEEVTLDENENTPDPESWYWFPAKVVGHEEQRYLELFHFSQDFGLVKPNTIVKLNDHELRYVDPEELEQRPEGPTDYQFMSVFTPAELKAVIHEASEELMKDNTSYKRVVAKTKDMYQSYWPVPAQETHSWPRTEFLERATLLFIRMQARTISMCTANVPADLPDTVDEQTAGRLGTEIFTPTLDSFTSEEIQVGERNKFNGSMGRNAANALYMFALMAKVKEACITKGDEERRSGAPNVGAQRTGARGVGGKLKEDDQILLTTLLSKATSQESTLNQLMVMMQQMQLQLKVRDMTLPAGAAKLASGTADVILAPPNHACGYLVLQALADRAENPESVLMMTETQEKECKMSIMMEAHAVFERDPEEFKRITQFEEEHEFVMNMTRRADTENWKGAPEGFLFAEAHPDLEIRTLLMSKGKATRDSTLKEGAPPRKCVGFSVLNAKMTHHDIGCYSTENEKNKFIFTPEEADIVEPLLKAWMEGDRQPKASNLAQLTSASSDAERREAYSQALAAGSSDTGNGTGWEVVANSQKKQQKAERAREKKERQQQSAAMEAAGNMRRVEQLQRELMERQREMQQWQMQQNPLPHSKGQSYAAAAGANRHGPSASWGQAPTTTNVPTAASGTPAWGNSRAGGEEAVPAVVVFGSGEEAELRTLLPQLDQKAAGAVVSVRKVLSGKGRCVVYCLEKSKTLVQSLVPKLLKCPGVEGADIYKEQNARGHGQNPKSALAGQSATGLSIAALKAGTCQYFHKGVHCPHAARRGCRFHCHGSGANPPAP
jgi:hypothetical protein